MHYLVDKRDLESILSTQVDEETSMHIYSNGVKYTRFGPVIYTFESKQSAKNFATQLLDEELEKYEQRVVKIKNKKEKLSKVK